MFSLSNRNLPWWLSISRVLFIPSLLWLLHAGYTPWFLMLYIAVGATDFIDGLVARRLNQTSEAGQKVDSLADVCFYIASAYFLHYLFPTVISNNIGYLMFLFALLGVVILVSLLLFKRLHLLHNQILRIGAVLVYLLVIASFVTDTTGFVRFTIFVYYAGLIEHLLIYAIYGEVDADTRSIFQLMGNNNRSS